MYFQEDKSTTEQRFERRRVTWQKRRAGDSTGRRSRQEEHFHSRHHRPRERYGERQCLRDTGQRSARRAPVSQASTMERQPECGGKPEEEPTITCQRAGENTGWRSTGESKKNTGKESATESANVRDTGRRSARRAPVPEASAKGRQPGYGDKPKEDPTIT